MPEEFAWYVAGWQDVTGTHFDVEHEPQRQPSESELNNADYVTVAVEDDHGNWNYVTLYGPWDDLDELEHDVIEWYEEGTP